MMDDLITLIEQDLGQPKRSGGWLFWHCPFHAGDDTPSLAVRNNRYFCFACQASGDAVDWLTHYRNLPMREALRQVKGDAPVPMMPVKVERKPAPEPTEPPKGWQDKATAWADECHQRLFKPDGARALRYLTDQRGLTVDTIRRFRLGYWAGGDTEFGHVRRCVTIPNFRGNRLFGVKLRHPDGQPKYTSLKGSHQRLFLCGFTAGDTLVLTEGEFDTLTLWQHCGDVVAVGTLGSCTALPNGADLFTIRTAERVIIAYDNDQPGQEGAQKVAELLGDAVNAKLPNRFKDINEAAQAGFDLFGWLVEHLPADAFDLTEWQK